jgi:hypothetical protein
MAALPHSEPRFCSRCGRLSDQPTRICGSCESGVLLSCRQEALPGEAFVICTYDLEISAVSEAGEELFGDQDELIGSQLLDVATCPLGDEQLARHVALAAARPREPVTMPVRLRSERGEAIGTLAARVTTCGPPRAALVTVQPTGFGRPKLVQ